MMIVNVPIEKTEGRYTEDWDKWFEKEIRDRQYSYVTIRPAPLTEKIKDGAFLDVIGTTWYKSRQVMDIALGVYNGLIPRDEKVVFLFQDGWFPIEQLAYIRDGLDCQYWKFVGIFHDGTYDKWDFTTRTNMYTWGEHLENSWFRIYDRVIVGSEYHRDVLLETRRIQRHQIDVIPWKVEVPAEYGRNWSKDQWDGFKFNQVVWPHRITEDKQPDSTLLDWIAETYPEWEVVFTKSQTRSKDEYYKLLSQSKIAISTAHLEMFGIAMREAVMLGCLPLVPNRLAYKEQYPVAYRYEDEKDFKMKFAEMVHDGYMYGEHMLYHLADKFKMHSEEFFDSIFDVVDNI